MVNLFETKSLNSRLFSELCLDEKHNTLLMHTEMRYLSRGRVIGRLFESREKVREFLRARKSLNTRFITFLSLNTCSKCVIKK